MINSTLKSNLIKTNLTLDKGTSVAYNFKLGKMYGFKKPRFYATPGATMTFYDAERIFSHEAISASTSPTVYFLDKKEIMIYVGYIDHAKTNSNTFKGNITKTIPCFFYNNTFVIPEPFIVNNPTMFFVEL